MLYDYIKLNIVMTAREFGIALGAFLTAFIIMGTTVDIFSEPVLGAIEIIFLLFGAAGILFLILGMQKLYQATVFRCEGSFYMTLPLSTWKVIWAKVLTGGFWLFFAELILAGWIVVLAGYRLFPMPGYSLADYLIKFLIDEGVPAGQIGPAFFLAFWLFILEGLLFCSGLLFASALCHSIRVTWFRKPFELLVYTIVIMALYGVRMGLWQLCGLVSPAFILLLEAGQAVINAGLCLLFVFLSKELMDKRLELY